MNIRKKAVAGSATVALALLGAMTLPSVAHASGSDSPTPYTVTETGVQLPEGDVFRAHGHINWRTTLGNGGMHFDPNNGHPGGAFIGQSFFPITLQPGECITWVQISHYNEHFGEGGQKPVCALSEEPPVKPEVPEEPEVPEVPEEEPEVPEVPEEEPEVPAEEEPEVPEVPEESEEPAEEVPTTEVPKATPADTPAPAAVAPAETLAVTGAEGNSAVLMALAAIASGLGLMLTRRVRKGRA